MSAAPLTSVAICGGGLAGYMAALALLRSLPETIAITLIETEQDGRYDSLFGTATSPDTYSFLLKLGIEEPELVLKTKAAFSLGTEYENWGDAGRSWVQSFHHPLPLFENVDFHHYLKRREDTSNIPVDLAPFIMSVQAAKKGVFAHPPAEKKTPLASVDFGYHISPQDWTTLFRGHVESSRIRRVTGQIDSVIRDGETLTGLTLSTGEKITADLYLDCSGVDALLQTRPSKSDREHSALCTRRERTAPAGVTRKLSAYDFGWQSDTPDQTHLERLTIFHPDSEDAARAAHGETDSDPLTVNFGRRDTAWTGNVVALGHAAAVIEPLTPAPIMLLQRDIERLLELIPVTPNMTVERREYNRRYQSDYENAELFQRALFAGLSFPDKPYWNAATAAAIDPRLTAKIQQFENRGVFVQYDYEPFKQQDWAMLHLGLGRIPRRYDMLADRAPHAKINATLDRMRLAIATMADKMPPHDVYMAGLKKYLKEKYG